MTKARLNLADLRQARRHPRLLIEPALDIERLLVVPERVGGLVQALVRHANRLQHIGARVVVPQLDRKGQRAVQRVERRLRGSAFDLDPAGRQKRVDVLGIAIEHFLQLVAGAVEISRAFEQPAPARSG